MQAPGHRRIWRSLLINPAMSAGLLGLLLLNWALLPEWWPGEETLAINIRRAVVGGNYGCHLMADPPTYLVTKPSGVVQVRDVLSDGSVGDAMTYAVDHPDKAAIARYRTSCSQSGVWAPLVEHRRVVIEFFDPAGMLSPADTAAARALIVADLPGQGFNPSAGLAQGDVERTTVLRSGVWRDALALVTVVLLVNSLRWAPAAVTWRRDRRLAAGLCTSCGYALAGLKGRVCPECGEPVRLSPAAPPPR